VKLLCLRYIEAWQITYRSRATGAHFSDCGHPLILLSDYLMRHFDETLDPR
jgi:hypothetical protein